MRNPPTRGVVLLGLVLGLHGCGYNKYVHQMKVDAATAEAVRQADAWGGLNQAGRWGELNAALSTELAEAQREHDLVRAALVLNELAEIATFLAPSLDRARVWEEQLDEALAAAGSNAWETTSPYVSLPTEFTRGRLYFAQHPEYIQRYRRLDRTALETMIRQRRTYEAVTPHIPGQDELSPEKLRALREQEAVFLRALRQRSPDPMTENRYLVQLAYAQLRVGDRKGLGAFARFMAGARAFDPKDAYRGKTVDVASRHLVYVNEDQYARLLGAAAKVAESLGTRDGRNQALRFYLEQAELLEDIRLTTSSYLKRIEYFAALDLVYERMVELAVDNGDARTALVYAERGKSRTLLDMLSDGGPPQLLVEKERMRQTLAVGQLPADKGGESLRTFRGLDVVRTSESSAVQVMMGLPALDEEKVAYETSGTTLIVEYLVLPDRLIRWQIQGSELAMDVIPTSREHVTALVEAVRRHALALKSVATSKEGIELGTLLFEGLPTGATTWAIVPDGPLHSAPFAILPWEGNALGLVQRHTTAPSFKLYLNLSAQGAAPLRQRAVVVANPPIPDPRFGSLPAAEAEGREIAALMGTPLLRGSEATEAAVRRLAAGATLLHLATHGLYSAKDPEASWVGLAAGDGEDGFLNSVEAMYLGLAPGATVVLSACDSGEVSVVNGDDLLGLRRAFIAARASTLVSSSWPVSDDATRLFMVTWYKARLDGASAGGAALVARRKVAERFPHDMDWGAWSIMSSE